MTAALADDISSNTQLNVCYDCFALRYYKQPTEYAMDRFAYYPCFKCKVRLKIV